MRPDHGSSRTSRNVVRSMNLHDVRLTKTSSSYANNFFSRHSTRCEHQNLNWTPFGTRSPNADIDSTTVGLFRKRNTERVGSVLRGIWLESCPKAHDPDLILRTCGLIDFMITFVPVCGRVAGTAASYSEVFFRMVGTPASYSEVADCWWLSRQYQWHVASFSLGQPKQNAGTVITCFKILSNSAFLRHCVWSHPGGVQIFQKFRSHLKILGPGRVTRGKFDISRHGDPVPGTCVPLVCSGDANNGPGWGILL